MTKEQRALLGVLRHELYPKIPLPDAEDIHWPAVLAEAQQQSVLLFACDALNAIQDKLPATTAEKMNNRSLEQFAVNMAVMDSQRKLDEILRDQPYVILKGETAASYYPRPDLRCLGDVDFLVDKQAFELLHGKFTDMGFSCAAHQYDHHITYHTANGVIEMHYEPPGIPSGAVEETVRDYLSALLETRQWRTSTFGKFPAPAHHLHGLILLLHMQHHMLSEGIGLRHLMDWGCFVAATADEPFWAQSLLPLLRKIGLLHYAATMTKLCSLHLATPCPDWAQYVDETLCDEVLTDILSGGNFGCKDALRAAAAPMVSDGGKSGTKRTRVGNLLAVFHRSVAARYPIATKYPVLYVIFYPIRAVRYIVLMLCGKRGSLTKALPQASKRRQLYGKLHIFETNEQ